jgi:hypothetical protein
VLDPCEQKEVVVLRNCLLVALAMAFVLVLLAGCGRSTEPEVERKAENVITEVVEVLVVRSAHEKAPFWVTFSHESTNLSW